MRAAGPDEQRRRDVALEVVQADLERGDHAQDHGDHHVLERRRVRPQLARQQRQLVRRGSRASPCSSSSARSVGGARAAAPGRRASVDVVSSLMVAPPQRDEVDDGEDHDPDDVDEVPVQPGDLDPSRSAARSSLPCIDRPHSDSSQMMPTVTCAPWMPVSTKKLEPNTFVLEREALAVELGELVDLAGDERQRRTARWR